MCGMVTLWGVNIHYHIQKSMVFNIIAKNQFQHVTHHNYTISQRPQHMYNTLSYCPCCTFCIVFLFWNLIIWISTQFAFTTATKRHTFYVPFSASARFGTHTRCWAFEWKGQVIGPARHWQYHWCYANIRCFIPILEWIWFGDCRSWGLLSHRTLQISSLYVFLYR